MTPFTMLTGIAAPLMIDNVDTDRIIPGRFLKTISRNGLGKALFHAIRYDEEGRERPDFILNIAPWTQAQILVSGDNFGCGSSREHAPWALTDFGIRVIVARGFADIFHGNCGKNGIVPIALPDRKVEAIAALAARSDTARMTVDLEAQTVRAGGACYHFDIAPDMKARLLTGADDITASLRAFPAIERYEAARGY